MFAHSRSLNFAVLLNWMSCSRRNVLATKINWKSFVVKDHYEFDKKVINSDIPVIVNFHAEWCEPCKILTPLMETILGGSTDIGLAVINVDDNYDLVETFEVKAVPAILAFRNGVVIDKFVGLIDNKMIESLIWKLKSKNV